MKPSIAALALAGELEAKGLRTAVLRSGGHQSYPCVWVLNERTECAEFVYVAPNDNDGLYFIYADTLEPIAPAEYIDAAAEMIAQAMNRLIVYGVRVIYGC